jgi:hypothetical protein
MTHAIKSSSIKTKKIVRNVDKNNNNFFALLGIEDCTAQSKISIHPEFVAFAFHLYGLSRKLFLFLIFFELDNSTCSFKINPEVIQRFHEFCSSFKEEEQKDISVAQAAATLVRKNVMIALDNEKYMLNPLIAGGNNEYKRRKLIGRYSKVLEEKGLDASLHFYPKYQPAK